MFLTYEDGLNTSYVYDNNRIIAEYDATGLIRKYVHGNSIDEILYMIKGANVYYYYYDGLGSVRAITDGSEAVVETYTYDVYGKPTIYDASGTKITESQVGNRYYFTGREFDKETGLYYYRARYYDPELGRFMSPDPVGPVDGPNLYTYCGNDSVNMIDPWGLAQIGQRALDGWPTMAGPAHHDQIWYDDGSNSGFFNTDNIREDTGHTRDDYDFGDDTTTYDDDFMRQAVDDLSENWDNDWRLWDNNCQDFCREAINQYGENLLDYLREKYEDALFGKK